MLSDASEPVDALADYVVPHPTCAGPSTPEELIWGETDDVSSREWTKLDEDFTNAGYREGITAGKESALQGGFDNGFARIGAPLGREIGVLRGAANAAMGLLSLRASPSGMDSVDLVRRRSEVWALISDLGRINLEDLAPLDLQAREHAKEHQQLEFGTTSGEVQVSTGANAHGINSLGSMQEQTAPPADEPLVVKPAVEELNRLRIRLSNILQGIGLDITLG